MLSMANAATSQGVELGKQRLREFLENSETARQALQMPARQDSDSISLDTLDNRGKKVTKAENGDELDDI
jgi:protein SEY1